MDTPAPNILVSQYADTDLVFKHFPGFAKFIRENHLIEYIQEQLRLSIEADLPIMKHIRHIPVEQLLEMGIPVHTEFLIAAENNTLKKLIEKSLKTWENDEMDILGRHDIATEDITVGTYIRKKAMLKFLPLYTNDPAEILELVNEIDTYSSTAITASSHTYINILTERINNHAYFIEQVTNTSPGAIYVYDLIEDKEIYSNGKISDILGYHQEDIMPLGTSIIRALVHPEDQETFQMNDRGILTWQRGEIKTVDCRAKHKNGDYIWLRSYLSAFKLDKDGTTSQIIGIVLNIDQEKRTQEDLQLNEDQLLEAQELAGMGSYVLDIEDDKFTATPQLFKIFCIETHEYRRDLLIEFIHPADRQKVQETRETALSQNSIFDCEYRILVKDLEKVIWVRGIPFIKNGRKMMKGTVMDVTERKHIIQRVTRSEELYRQAQAMSHIGNWTWDLSTNKITWSDELYRIYGLEPGIEISGELIRSITHPEDIEYIRGIIGDAKAKLEPYDFHYRIILQNGQTKVVNAKGNILTDSDGVVFKLLGTVQDITKEYIAEEQLKTNKEFIQKITNVSPSLLASYNVNTGKYTFLNQAFEKVLGYKIEEISEQGVSFFENIIHPDDLAPLLEKNARALADANNNRPINDDEMTVEFEYRMKNTKNEYRWFRTYGTIFDRDSEGHVQHVLNVSVDITEQKEAEQAVHRKNIELLNSNASLEEFAYIASHDLKEPLRKISTFGDLLLENNMDALDDDGKKYVDKIIASARRMQTMIDDLMSLSTISAKNRFEYVDLNDIMADVTGLLEFNIRKMNAVVNFQNLPVIKADASQFRQLFQNLLSNSLKFSSTDSQPVINITSSAITQSEALKYGMKEMKQYVKIEFSDNGIGFENEYAGKIFTIFQRLYSKSQYEGNGIGLAICKKVVENHKGTIFASGQLNKGALFTIIVPV